MASFLSTQKKLNIFKRETAPTNNECKWDNANPIKSCPSIERITTALDYYSLLNMDEHLDIFASFINDLYNTQFLDDFGHLLATHDRHLHSISDALNGCGIEKCAFTHRHNNLLNHLSDIHLCFWAQALDAAHFQIFHLFEAGMRSVDNGKDDEEEKNESDEDSQYYDAKFAKLMRRMKDKNKMNATFARFKSQNNKFSLTQTAETNTSNVCFLNAMLKFLMDKGMDLLLLQKLINKEEFDTDAFKMDIAAKANLFQTVKGNTAQAIEKYIAQINLQSNTFSIGYRWYYWSKYSTMEQLSVSCRAEDNINDHNGFQVKDLYVMQKHSNFKEEIMAYPNITMKQYLSMMVKARAHLKTANVKKPKAMNDILIPLHYNIDGDTPLSIWNLICLLLYTDYSAHCTAFSASFRALNVFEPMSLTKERNRNYWWMAKTLRETVELYGQCRYAHDTNGSIFGPFYCGVNRILVLPQFNLRLCAPTSTTVHIEVAYKFATSEGSSIQMNNDRRSTWDFLRCFNVSFLSRFPDEDERCVVTIYFCLFCVCPYFKHHNFQTFCWRILANKSPFGSAYGNQAKFWHFYGCFVLF